MNEVLTCPKCRGTMRTHMRQGVHVEQCDMCRGIFLDYGELESISRLGGGAPQQHMPAPPPMGHAPQQQWGHAQPGWGHGHHGHHHHHGFARMFFSS
jgi:Zn-finger nucleic acid-binding protein